MEIVHEKEAARFVAKLEAGEAELTYIDDAGKRVLNLIHTYVPEEARGGGLASELVEYAIDYARANDYRIRATCPYVRKWVDEHPEVAEMVVSGA